MRPPPRELLSLGLLLGRFPRGRGRGGNPPSNQHDEEKQDEKGEKVFDTVVREIWEETGLKSISQVPDFRREIEYFYRRQGELVHKSVVFLLMRSEDDSVRLSDEHQNYAWFAFQSALKKVTYSNSKRVLTDADRHMGRLRI